MEPPANKGRFKQPYIDRSWRYYTPSHGTVCLAALQMPQKPFAKLCDDEKLLWNLAPTADVLLLPVREEKRIDKISMEKAVDRLCKRNSGFELLKEFTDTWIGFWENRKRPGLKKTIEEFYEYLLKECSDYKRLTLKMISILLAQAERKFLEEQQFGETFEILIEKAKEQKLSYGDIITVPMAASIQPILKPTNSDGPDLPAIQLPLIHYKRVENAIATLTKEYGISVIIASGNGAKCLDDIPGEEYLLGKKEARKYQNRGVKCGAILVGAKPRKAQGFLKKIKVAPSDHSKEKEQYPNYGKCIDVYGRYRASKECLRVIAESW